ncbi:GntR family transcriptional regulator [Tuberibacillus sp. Marseille-P3662]|uniref:GntR family transcriptional regulator n=1 Tax=Tuberibacillus sp. Marseille-P3662 TaxID=1965358 RepID=UPI000A1CD5C7|nr:GntR family transcriptional regulator [Tuberibacillus sp. Marseille-P3662]
MLSNKPGTALYYLVKEQILELIRNGTYEVGSQLPTESDLCTFFDVSRTTIRLALQQLELEGQIHKIQGKGTFVSEVKINEQITQNIKSFSEQMKDAGLNPYSKVLNLDVTPATILLENSLNIQQDDPVIKLERLRYAGDKPYQHSTSFIPWKIAPGLLNEDCSHSLFELLQSKFNIRILKSIESIEPILPDKTICDMLNIPEKTASFLLKSHTYSTNNIPVEYSVTIVRGDSAKFLTERHFKE